MTKFNKRTTQPAKGQSFVVTETRSTTTTALGGVGFARDAKSELYMLALANMAGEKTYHEAAPERDGRYIKLIQEVASVDPTWLLGLFGWLRSEANMRSASIVGALEAAKALVLAKVPGGRQMVAAALQRADEPGEAVAYWQSNYGRAMPKPIKRGIADAATRLYNEYALLKYDTVSHGVRFADVLELTHPSAAAPWQSDLFRFALARRHNRDEEPGELLSMVRNQAQLRKAVGAGRAEALLSSQNLKAAGFTWEDALSLAGNKVSKKALWEAMIPNMGIMALIRNLRNFDQAGVSDEAAQKVIDLLRNPEVIAKSRQFPFRFLAAHRATAHSLRWAYPLEQALKHSTANIPELSGRTLVLVDRSGSMFSANTGALSELTRADAAAVFGSAIALRNISRTTLVQFGTGAQPVKVRAGDSVLSLVNSFGNMGGTNTAAAVRTFYDGHDRVIIVTDEQAHDGDVGAQIPAKVPLYTWNLGGYRVAHAGGGTNRHAFGGLTDASFKIIPLLEKGASATWPWLENQS